MTAVPAPQSIPAIAPEDLVLGVDTFGDVPADAEGHRLSDAEALRAVFEEGVLADQVGVDVFAVGEHHRKEYSISSPETLLAGLATRTDRIRLSSAVTVLSSDDPVRVYQRFATVDALSNGRAEVILGRGSFTESFPLFGYDLADYEVLFEEKLDLFVKLLDEKPVTWSGTRRPALQDAQVFPRTAHEHGIPTWIGVGGSPQSVVRTAQHSLPLMLAIIGGEPIRFRPYVDLYHRAAAQLGTTAQAVGMHSHGHIAATDEQALEEHYGPFAANRDAIGRERGWGPLRKQEYLAEVRDGALYVGSPRTVAEKMARNIAALGVSRFDFIYAAGANRPEVRLSALELYGTQVIPMVRELLADSAFVASATAGAGVPA
ncbi:LLM class flavin-dependent oxidoreductase [Brachybacterium sp. DNPG3]